MSDAISVECPQCHARLKLKSRSALGKKVPCPKCKKPFVVSAPPEDEDELGFMNVAEPDDEFAGLAERESDEDELPAAPAPRGKQRGRNSGSAESNGDMSKWLIIASGSLAAIGLLIAAGIFGIPLLASWMASGNKIDTAWLPPDADVVIHSRLAETWSSPLVQSIVNVPTMKPQLDRTWSMVGIDPSSVSSITIGVSGVTERMAKEMAKRQPTGEAGMPIGGSPPVPSFDVPGVVVVRTKSPDDLSKIKEKFKNGRTGTHQGAEYLVPPVGGDVALYFATADTLVMSTEREVKLAIEWGRKGVRRPDLDFVDPTQMVLVAWVPKDMSVLEATPPGGRPAGWEKSLPAAMHGKVKGFCLGLSATDKLDLSIATNCNDNIMAEDVLKATEKSLNESKAEFAKFRDSVPPMFGELVQLADQIISSTQVSSSGGVVSTRATIPGSVKSTIDKLPMMITMWMMKDIGGPPGMNPFAPPGAPGAPGFPGGAQLPGNLPPGTFPPPGNPSSLGGAPPGTLPPPGAGLQNGGPLYPPPGKKP